MGQTPGRVQQWRVHFVVVLSLLSSCLFVSLKVSSVVNFLLYFFLSLGFILSIILSFCLRRFSLYFFLSLLPLSMQCGGEVATLDGDEGSRHKRDVSVRQRDREKERERERERGIHCLNTFAPLSLWGNSTNQK